MALGNLSSEIGRTGSSPWRDSLPRRRLADRADVGSVCWLSGLLGCHDLQEVGVVQGICESPSTAEGPAIVCCMPDMMKMGVCGGFAKNKFLVV